LFVLQSVSCKDVARREQPWLIWEACGMGSEEKGEGPVGETRAPSKSHLPHPVGDQSDETRICIWIIAQLLGPRKRASGR